MIRPYLPTDLEAVLDTWYQSTTLAHPFMTEAFKAKERKNIEDIYIKNTITSVFEKEGSIIGFIAMIGNEVGAIFVQPAQIGKGIGRQLMDHVRAQHETLEVEVFKANTIGRAFYERYGFTYMKEYIHEETGQTVLRLKLS